MNSTLIQTKSAGFASGLPQAEDAEATGRGNSPVGAGALAQRVSQQRDDEPAPRLNDYYAPPRPREPVTLRLAEGALNRILAASGAQSGGKPITLAELERTPMDAMTLAAALLSVKSLGNTADLKSAALEIRTKGAENLRLRQNEDLRKQIDKAIEDSQKAHKGGIFSAIIDWVISIAEVISGVAKIVAGDYAGGAMDLAAGCSGLVKAFAETMALVSSDEDAKKWKEVADVAGKIQLAFEIAGMCVDALSLGRGFMATRAAVKGTETVLERGAGEVLHAAVQTGSKELVTACAENIGKQVAEEVAAQVAKDIAAPLCEKMLVGTFGKEAAKEIVKHGSKEVIEEAIKQAIAKTVSDSVKKIAEKAIDEGVEVTVKELSQQITKQVQSEVMQSVLKASIKSTANIGKHTTQAVANGVNGVAQGVIAKERAELQKIIQMLAAEGTFMQFLLDDFEKMKKRVREDVSQLLDGSSKALSAASDTQAKTGAVLCSIAQNIA